MFYFYFLGIFILYVLMAASSQQYVLGIDVGTTCVKAVIYDENLTLISKTSRRVPVYEPQPGWSEIVPEDLWKATTESVKEAIKNSGKRPKDIACLGICVQRNSFITWDSNNGQPLHNFITWKDKRSQHFCEQWNSSKTIRGFKTLARGFAFLTGGQPRWTSVVNFRFFPAQSSMRLLWALNNIETLQDAVAAGRARFGSVETWLVWRLTGGRTWAAEASCAATSGLYDVYASRNWNKALLAILHIPPKILPPVYDSVFSDFGTVESNIFGAPIPITAVLADQSAANVGECCFTKASAKVTLGTGAFLNVTTGVNKPIAVTPVVFPVIAFKHATNVIFAAEIYLPQASHVGNIVDSLVSDGYISDLSLLDQVANSVPDTAGVVFLPNRGDGKVGHKIEGRTAATKPAHIVRAALLSVAEIVKELALRLEDEAPGVVVFGNSDKNGDPMPPVRIDGGVSRSDFVCQAVANALDRKVERLLDVDASVRGIAMLAGYGANLFPSVANLEVLALGDSKSIKVFIPQK